jgi:hypothetical protein
MRRRQLFPNPPWWLNSDLMLSAPLCDASNPVAVYRGAMVLTPVRATAALRFDGTKYVSVGNNVIRIEPQGALFEGQRSNIMLQTDTSQDLLAQWTKANITSAFEDDANGYGSKRWTLTADASDRLFIRSITIPAAAHCFAFYVRKAAGAAVTAADCNIHCDNADVASTYTLIGNGIYRVSWENFVGANAARNNGLRLKAGKTVHLVAPPMLEAGAYCSSPFPTTAGAGTRNTDGLSVPRAGVIADAAGTMVLTFDTIAPRSIVPVWSGIVGIGADVLGAIVGAFANSIIATDGTNYPNPSIAVGEGDPSTVRYAITWNAAGGYIHTGVNGVVTPFIYDGSWANADIEIGARAGNPLWGHLRDLRFWNRTFTDAELGNITR